VTVPVATVDPVTEFGLSETDARAGGVTVRTAVSTTVPSLPVIVAVSWVATADVFTVKLALIVPAATVTDAGTVTPAKLLDNLIVIPPFGA